MEDKCVRISTSENRITDLIFKTINGVTTCTLFQHFGENLTSKVPFGCAPLDWTAQQSVCMTLTGDEFSAIISEASKLFDTKGGYNG